MKPLDTGLIGRLAAEIPKIITVEDNVLAGGFSGAVLETLNDQGISGFTLKRLGIDDTFVEHGAQDTLRSLHGLDAVAIAEAARRMTADKKTPA